MRTLKIRKIGSEIEFELSEDNKKVFRYHQTREIDHWGNKKWIICQVIKELHIALDNYLVLLSGESKVLNYLLESKYQGDLC